MEKGEEAVVTIAPAYAYGDVGCPPRIPPRSHVQLLLRLLYIEWPTIVRCATVAAHRAVAAHPSGVVIADHRWSGVVRAERREAGAPAR
jgi:hypothetical protein